MKKKILISVLIAVTIIVVLVGIMIKSAEPPPITPPPKFEYVEMKLNESTWVKGNLITLISIEEEKGMVEIEAYNETTGEPIIVPLSLQNVEAFKYKNIAIFLSKIEDNRAVFLIFEAAYSEGNMEVSERHSTLALGCK
jgi:hypothetical protein